MNAAPHDFGIVILCQSDGDVVAFLRDDPGWANSHPLPVRFEDFFNGAHVACARDFLEEIRVRGPVFDWEISAPYGGRVTPMVFQGSRVDRGVLILGALARSPLRKVNDDLVQINNEQASALRSAAKEISTLNEQLRKSQFGQ